MKPRKPAREYEIQASESFAKREGLIRLDATSTRRVPLIY